MLKNIALIIEHYFDPNSGGVQQSTSKLAMIFKQKGFNVIIISASDININNQQWNDVNIYYIGNSKNQKKELFFILRYYHIEVIINQAGFNIPLTKNINITKPLGTILINTLRLNPLTFVENYKITLKQYFKTRNLAFLDNFITRKFILLYHYNKQNRDYLKILNKVDSVVLLSESFKKGIYRLCPKAELLSKKIVAIPNPFPISEYRYSIDLKLDVILFVGRLNIFEKRVDILMSLWKKLHQKLPSWEFWVVGYGPEENYMKEYCQKNRLSNIKFWGKDNPEIYYSKAKIFHFTSASEGFGNVLIEAQRYGCVPILFNSYSAAEEIIGNEKNGFLIPPFDEEEFITKTLQIANDTALLEKMAIASINNSSRFSYDNIYKLWENLFTNLSPQSAQVKSSIKFNK